MRNFLDTTTEILVLESVQYEDGKKVVIFKKQGSEGSEKKDLQEVFAEGLHKSFSEESSKELSEHYSSLNHQVFLGSTELRKVAPLLAFFASFMVVVFLIALVPNKLILISFSGHTLERYISSFLFPALFLIAAMSTEVYGYAASRLFFYLMGASAGVACLWAGLAEGLEGASHSPWQPINDPSLGFFSKALATNTLLYLAFDFLNTFLVSKFKVKKIIKNAGVRIIFSSVVASSFLVVFGWLILGVLVFRVNVSFSDIGYSLFYNYLFIALFGFPAARLAQAAKNFSRVDHYDFTVNYNPFRLGL